jgi:hypothetical protein
MQKEIGLAGRCGFALLAVAIVPLPIALFAKAISIEVFSAVSVVWLLVSAVMIFGDSITEITLWKTSIKRDVRAAQEARQGAEEVLAQLQSITRLVIENEYVLLSGSQLAELGHPSVEHVQGNLDLLTEKILVAGEDKEKWQARMKAIMQQPYTAYSKHPAQ